MSNGSGLAALMGILRGTGEGLSKNVEDQQKAADLAEKQRQANMLDAYHNKSLDVQNFTDVTPELAPSLGIPVGKYPTHLVPILTGQAKESRANNQWTQQLEAARKANQETTTI